MANNDDVMTPGSEDTLMVQQREVQRKLGRNLLKLQQVERMLKAFWVDHEVSGEASELLTIQERRRAEVADKTLGTVAKKLVGTFLANESEEINTTEKDSDATHFSMRSKMTISLSKENFDKEKTELEALIAMRNEVVHHFLESYDLANGPSCIEAGRHLDQSLDQINAYLDKLRGWAEAALNGRDMLASFLNSEAGRDMIIYGIMPGGEVHWETSRVVAQLRWAEEHLKQDGWTSLNAAVAFLRERDREISPRKYGCSRWRHLLHETGLFNVQLRKGALGTVEDVLFCSKA